MSKAKLLFAASEVFPFAKSGGLADVAHSLPRALNNDYDLHVVLPLYRFIQREQFNITALDVYFDVSVGGVVYPVSLYECTYEAVHYIFIYSFVLCERDFLYGLPESGYEDNAVRFGIFNYAIVELLRRESYAIAHLNDWQCALVPLLLRNYESMTTKTLFTIHNLAYQGVFSKNVLQQLGIGKEYFTMEGIEFYDQVNFMKAGIAYADMITTVSPTYANEILTQEFGCALEGFLQKHRHKLTGILNGIDTRHFSPSDDKALEQPYSDSQGKHVNKKACLKQLNLKGVKAPLFLFIGRFNWQKGMELLIASLPHIAQMECNVIVLGEGEAIYHQQLQAIANEYANIHLEFGYDESLSHRLYAAADFLLMPSLFEPCGLNQMIAMHYGTMPIVHHIGGLVDTVHDYNDYEHASNEGYGIYFVRPTQRSFMNAVHKAFKLYAERRRFNTIVKHNMASDFSWHESALSYQDLYCRLIFNEKS
jgi:starch synthase